VIDIVIGGPPCGDHSMANANRKGLASEQGSYLTKFGELIRCIQSLQPNHHVFFLAENTIITNAKSQALKEGDLEQVKKAFGITWSNDFDANICSPACRNRTFFSNIPFSTNEGDYAHNPKPESCLQDHFKIPVNIPQPKTLTKTNCFMAHKSRIDDDRMTVAKKVLNEDNEWFETVARPINALERELIMGFPRGYVKKAGIY
jgi:sulfur relay (sulfurtransferase) complex TusBCD TusD component (DsrE family)